MVAAPILMLYGAARLLSAYEFWRHPDVEPPLCRLGICSNDYLLQVAHQRQLQGGQEGVDAATAAFREALRRDPASPYRWCDLGEALLDSARLDEAKYCMSRAVELGGGSPFILLRAANFQFRLGETRPALHYTSTILKTVSEYDPVIFATYTRLVGDVPQILQYGLPDDRRAGQSCFRYLLGLQNLSDTQAAWTWITSHSFADIPLTSEYVTFLLTKRQYDLAADVWANYQISHEENYQKQNILFNGDFELPPTGCRLDWSVSQVSGAQVRFDARSLRIIFAGTDNLNYSHVSQTAVVRPGRYRLQARLRTAGLTTDRGVGLRVVDAEVPARLKVATETLLGDNDWRKLETTFVVPPATRLVDVQVFREPSLKFDNKIAGTVWIDAVSLAPEVR